MSVKCILQGQNDQSLKLSFDLPIQPKKPIALGEEIPWSWEEINAIALSGKAEDYFSLGSIKLCKLDGELLGSTDLYMQVIGINQDGNGTVTFQTQDCLKEPTVFFKDKEILWSKSVVRTICQKFYALCEAKDYIKIVKKGTCITNDFNGNSDIAYNDETVFLPSAIEMGFDSGLEALLKKNSSLLKAECTYNKIFSYEYYTIKPASKEKNEAYWTRSLSNNGKGYVCSIVGETSIEDTPGTFELGYSDDAYISPAFVIGKVSLTQNSKDVTEQVKNIVDTTNIISLACQYTLPAKPAAPIAADEEIPYSWDELNAIALSGEATDYVSVGAIKSVILNKAVLGTTSHDVRIIGINQDNDQSITFQTKNCLNNTASFLNETNICLNYYNAFSNKNIIKIVSKGICAEISTGSNRNGSVTYADETVWLPSEREMGLDSYSSISTANSTTSKAECTQGKNFAYNYYTSDSNRIKTLGDNTGTATRYLERSQNYNSMNLLCIVSTDGQAGGAYNNTLIGFAPAFVIGNEEALSKDTLIQDGRDITDKIKEIVKPTIEEIGAVPYLGMKSCASDSEAEAAIDTFYGAMPGISAAYASINMTAGSELFNGGVHTLFLSKTTQDAGYVQRAMYDTSSKGTAAARKVKYAGAWQPWEFFDPPLTLGVEYRTTERYQGKAVYKKLDTDNIIKWRIDGETEWKPEVQYTGAAAVLAINVPSRTVTVAASELAAYVAALPRLLTENLTISVTSGTVSETLMLDGFYGSGRLTIAQASGASVQCTKGIRIQYCTLRIRLYNLTVSGEGAVVGGFQELISIGPASFVYVDTCTLTGNGSSRGISAAQSCFVEVASCTITHTNIALLMSKASVCAAYNCTASSNTTGAYVYYGGCIMLAGSTPDTMGGSSNKKSGGIIAKADGTLL